MTVYDRIIRGVIGRRDMNINIFDRCTVTRLLLRTTIDIILHTSRNYVIERFSVDVLCVGDEENLKTKKIRPNFNLTLWLIQTMT